MSNLFSSFKARINQSLIKTFIDFYIQNIPVLVVLFFLRIFEFVSISQRFFFIGNKLLDEAIGLVYDLWFWLIFCIIAIIPYLVFVVLNKRIGRIWQHIINHVLIICSIGLLVTFSERSVPFGHEFFIRNATDIFETIQQIISGGYIVLFLTIGSIAIYWFVTFIIFKIKKQNSNVTGLAVTFIGLSLLSIIFCKWSVPADEDVTSNIQCNKISFFVKDSYSYFRTKNDQLSTDITENTTENQNLFSGFTNQYHFNYLNPQYPLLRKDESKDVLGGYFKFTEIKPNIVVILVESLARAYSGNGATYGSFTPFIDSLEEHSLYWENCLSVATGSFGVLPATVGALPYFKKGFSNMGKYPEHQSIIKILKSNGYYSFYFYGGSLSFDNYGSFMGMQGTDYILNSFNDKYQPMPSLTKGRKGSDYPDDALFNQSLDIMDSIQKKPFISYYFTLSTHGPYLFPNKKIYDARFNEYIKKLELKPEIKQAVLNGKDMLTSFLFLDDCLRNFIEDYKKRPEFNNTIFIIAGDHMSGKLPAENILGYYHVPLIIYSPLLIQPKKFSSVNTHNNIPQTLVTLLKGGGFLDNYSGECHWIGDVLDTCPGFRNIHTMPLVEWNYTVDNMLVSNYFIRKNSLSLLKEGLKLEPVTNDSILDDAIEIRNSYKSIDQYVCKENKLLPKKQDSQNILLKQIKINEEQRSKKGIIGAINYTINKPFAGTISYELSVEMIIDTNIVANIPIFVTRIKDKTSQKEYWAKRDIKDAVLDKIEPSKWFSFEIQDSYKIDNYLKNDGTFNLSFQNPANIPFRIRNLKISVYYSNTLLSGKN